MKTYSSLVCAVCLLAVLVPAALAQPLDCGANAEILKTTIAGITNKLDYHGFTISGICNGPIIIRGFRDLNISGTSGAVAKIQGGTGSVVNITASENVTLSNLSIDGGGSSGLIAANHSKEVKVYAATLENGTSGVICEFGSWCWVWDVDFKNISGNAIWAAGQSQFDVGVVTSYSSEPVAITNSGVGIKAQERSQVDINGNFSIASMNTNAVGIDVSSAQVRTMNCSGTKSVIGARQGVNVSGNGEFIANCPLTIQGNSTGITAGASYVNLGDSVSIEGNGTSGQPGGPGGILARDGAVVTLAGSKVKNNFGIGMLLSNNVTGSISGAAEILDNGGMGILVTRRSALQLAPGYSISGNGTADLVCSVQGTAYGDASGIAKKGLDCRTFEQIQ